MPNDPAFFDPHDHRCGECGGDGVVEYEGDPLDDFIDADPTQLVPCRECGGSGYEDCAECDVKDAEREAWDRRFESDLLDPGGVV